MANAGNEEDLVAFALRNTTSHVAEYCRELPLEAGELIEKALDKARDDECLKVPDLVDTSWSKRQADAFVTMLKEYLQGSETNATKKSSDNYLVNIHVDQSALAGEVGRSSVPIEQLMLLCSKHHTLVHEGGLRIDRDFLGNWSFFRPDGIAVPDCGYHSRDMLDDDIGVCYDDPPRYLH